MQNKINHKNYKKYIYEICFKNRVFLFVCFFKVIIDYNGEGNGNPLQYSCLEHPRNGGAWLAAVYVVPESDMIEVT